MRYRVASAVLTAALLSFFLAPNALADELVPDVVGLRLDQAKALLEQGGYDATLEFDAARPAGIVFGQVPGGLASRPKGTRVTLSVGGTAPAPGPDLPPAGTAPRDPMPADPAPADPRPVAPSTPAPGGDDLGTPPGGELPADPLDLGDPPTGTPDKPAPVNPVPTLPADPTPTVPEPGPRPGVTPAPGPAVAVDPQLDGLPFAPRLDRRGPEIPDVLGQTRAAARGVLSEWRIREELTLSVPSLVGTVINQWPMPGMPLAPGEEVTVQVAVAQSPSIRHRSIPVTIGKSIGDAQQALRRFGFVGEFRRVRSRPSRYGMGVWQQPMAGSLALEGELVVVHFGVGDGTTPVLPPADPTTTEPGPLPTDPLPTTPVAPRDPTPTDPDAPPAGMPALPPLEGPLPGTPPKPPVDLPPVDMPPTGPGPKDPVPRDPAPRDPAPRDPAPKDPIPQDPPEMRSPLARPTLISPPAGESYPRAYGATFEWSKVTGATAYEWELEEEQPSGAWRKVDKAAVKATRHRPNTTKRGRYRWRVRATSGQRTSDWSGWFRLYMY